MTQLRHLLRATAVLALVSSARAQFPGDVFFEDPTPVVQEGGQVSLLVQTFTGTDVFGATLIDLAYDPLEFRLDRVEPVTTVALTTAADFSRTPVGAGFAAYNGTSLTRPYGSLSLVRVVGTPLVLAGRSTQLTLVPRSILRPDGSAFPNLRGFSALISVESTTLLRESNEVTVRAALPYAPGLDARFPVTPLRRLGHAVARVVEAVDAHGRRFLTWHRERRVDGNALQDVPIRR